MKIKRIQIKNFKSIKEVDLELKELNIFIGANGSGKSNFISFFTFLNHLLEHDLKHYVLQQGGYDTFLFFGRKYSSEIFFRIDFDDRQYYTCKLIPTAGEFLLPKDVTLSMDARDNSADSGMEIHDKMEDNYVSEYMKKTFAASKIYHFHDTGPSAKLMQMCDIHDNRYLNPDGSNLAAFLYYLQKKHEKHFTQIQDTIRLIAPFFSKFEIAPFKLNEAKILLQWKHIDYDDVYFKPYHLSDGTLRMMCLITLLLQPELPDIILIDEPEIGLHPSAITILSSLLQSAATEAQIIVSTQSVTLIDHFEPEDIVVVDRKNNQSIFRRLNEKDISIWLEEYSLGEIWEKNIIGGRP